MTKVTRNRKTETKVYIVLWLIAIGLWMLDVMRSRSQSSQPLLDFEVVKRLLDTMLPFLILFLINNVILIPRLLLRNRYTAYFLTTAMTVVVVWSWQCVSFNHFMQLVPPEARPIPHPTMKPLLPMPLLLDFTYALLVVGVNLAVALMFQRFEDKLVSESLMKVNAENELAYLKAQINPHFYMNMLNNIHGMIEINPEHAQSMVIDMSHLMRYMLYDSSLLSIPLTSEIAFLKKYIDLMAQRFPEDKVAVTYDFPDRSAITGIKIPPLLFLVFIENAFKHGVSYVADSFVKIKIVVKDNQLKFMCSNSFHQPLASDKPGIGLQNVKQRLSLIYGNRSTLDIEETLSTYEVNLTIPLDEIKDPDN